MSLIARVTALAQAVGADIKSVKGQISAAATALAANVRGTVLTGLSTATATAVLATDTVLAAFGKIQGRLNALGTAANANLTTSLQDTTVGNVLKVGDFGLGGDAILLAAAVSWDTITTPGEYYVPTASGTNAPGSGNYFVKVTRTSNNTWKQLVFQLGTAVMYSRVLSGGSWSGWDRSISLGNVVGTVSQTSGTPTGAIYERGSLASGEYIKYADGTMEFWFNSRTAAYVDNSTLQYNWTFPSSFISTSTIDVQVTATGSVSASARVGLPYHSTPTVSSVGLFILSNGAISPFSSGDQCPVSARAIGRWF